MPIEFAPPPVGNLQGFQVPTSPQYSDPLATLAQMQQMKTQRLQQQSAEIGLQQQKMKMASQQGLLKAFVDAQKEDEQPPAASATPGQPTPAVPAPAQAPGQPAPATPTPAQIPGQPAPAASGQPAAATPAQAQTPTSVMDRVYRNAVRNGVLPEDLIAFQEHRVKLLSDTASLDEKDRAALDKDINAVRGAYANVTDQPSLMAANQDLQRRGAFRSGKLTPVTQFTDPAHLTAYGTGLAGYSEVLAEAKAKAEREKEEALTEQAKAATTETKQKTATGEREAAIREYQAAIDPVTGVAPPAASAAIQQRHPSVQLPPGTPTRESVAAFVRSQVPPKDQPEYDIKQAEVGAMGNLTPENIGKMVAGSIDSVKYPDQYQRTLNDTTNALRLGLGVKGIQAAIKDGSDRIAARENVLAGKNPVELAMERTRLSLEQQRLGVERRNAGLDENTGKPLQYADAQGNPINISPLARQIAAYKMSPASARSYNTNRGLMDQVLAVNPNWDIGQYEQRYQTYKDLGPGGKLGQQALALNTLIRHSDDLIDAVKDLGNGNFTPANAGYQKLVQLFGGSAPTNFDQLKQYVAGETVKLVRGGAGNKEDEANAAANINRANSPKQLLDALRINFGVAGGKMQALNQSVRSAINDQKFTALDPGAAQILTNRGYDTETMKPRVAVAAPQKGDRQTHQGRAYVFDGTKWVGQ